MKTYLEYQDEKSNKFWEIEINGTNFTVRYGKIGADGQTLTKTFGSEEEAKQEADKLIADKVKKGYRQPDGQEVTSQAMKNSQAETSARALPDIETISAKVTQMLENWSGFELEKDLPRYRRLLQQLESGQGIGELHQRFSEKLLDGAAEKRLVLAYAHQSKKIDYYDLSPCGRWLAVASSNDDNDQGAIQVWELASGRCVNAFGTVEYGFGWPGEKENCLKWSPDGMKLAASYYGTNIGDFKAFENNKKGNTVEPGTCIIDGYGMDRPANFCWEPAGQSLAVDVRTAGGGINCCIVPLNGGQIDISKMNEVFTGDGLEDIPRFDDRHFYWSKDGKFIYGLADGKVMVLDAVNRSFRYWDHQADDLNQPFSPEGCYFITKQGNRVQLHSLAEMISEITLDFEPKFSYWLPSVQEPRFVLADANHVVLYHNSVEMQRFDTKSNIQAIEVAKDGQNAVLLCDTCIEVWSLAHTPVCRQIIQSDHVMKDIRLGADNMLVVFCNDRLDDLNEDEANVLEFWDLNADEKIAEHLIRGLYESEDELEDLMEELDNGDQEIGAVMIKRDKRGYWGAVVKADRFVLPSKKLKKDLSLLNPYLSFVIEKRWSWPWHWANGTQHIEVGSKKVKKDEYAEERELLRQKMEDISNGGEIDAAIDDTGYTALMVAAKIGDIDLMKQLIETKADVNAKTKSGTTALMLACNCGHTEAVRLLIEAGANVHHKNEYEETALGWAVDPDKPEIIKLLIDAKADFQAKDDQGYTPLIVAAAKGCTEIVKFLLEKQVEIDARNYNGDTALILAAKQGCTKAVKLLIEAKADLDAKNNDGNTALILAAGYKYLEIEKLLIHGGSNPYEKNNEGKTAYNDDLLILILFDAVTKNSPESIKSYIKNIGKLDITDDQGLTALMLGAQLGQMEAVKTLIVARAKMDLTNKKGETALMLAENNDHHDVAELLKREAAVGQAVDRFFDAIKENDLELITSYLHSGYDVNRKNQEGCPALVWAAQNGQAAVVKLLIEAKAEVNATFDKSIYGDRMTALMAAGDDAEITKVLLDSGADVHLKDDKGKTALIWAVIKNNLEVIKLLIAGHADVDATDKYGESTFLIAAFKGNVEILKFLSTAGADIHLKNSRGETALIQATDRGNIEAVKHLIEAGLDINAKNKDGESALFLAANNNYPAILELLINAGAEISVYDGEGENVLIKAVQKRYIEVVKILIKAKVDVNAKDRFDRTALSIANGQEDSEMIKLLLEAGADTTNA